MKLFLLSFIAIVIGTVGGLAFSYWMFEKTIDPTVKHVQKISSNDPHESSVSEYLKPISPSPIPENKLSSNLSSGVSPEWTTPPARHLAALGYVNSLGYFSTRKQAEDATIYMLFYRSRLFQNVRLQIMKEMPSLGFELLVGPFKTLQDAVHFCQRMKEYRYICWTHAKVEQL